jgi:hypothetical protein
MLIYDDVYTWDGWGGLLKLASGRCRMKVFDLRKKGEKGVAHLKPFVIVLTDIPFETKGPNQMTVKSCAGHIATKVVREFRIDPHRMIWVEHYPLDPESHKLRYPEEEHFDEVEFTWQDEDAISTQWRTPSPDTVKLIRELLANVSE